MKKLTILIPLLLLTLSACSHTSSTQIDSQKNYSLPKHDFTLYDKQSTKQLMSSDHQLFYALMNRPLPKDQQMMLAFEKRQANYFVDNAPRGVQIKGSKKENDTDTRNTSQYAQLIAQDRNAVLINNVMLK